MTEQKPLVALNVYLTSEFRRQILSEVLDQKNALNSDTRTRFLNFFKEKLKVPGFRNSTNAPKAKLIKATEALFEKDSNFISAVLNAWTELIQSKTIGLDHVLQNLGFDLKMTDTSYSEHDSSFEVGWPKAINYESLFTKVTQQLKAFELNSDELAMVTIWKTGKLPGDFESVKD